MQGDNKGYYKTFGLSIHATQEEISEIYNILKDFRYGLDLNNLVIAYSVLSDPIERAIYNSQQNLPESQGATAGPSPSQAALPSSYNYSQVASRILNAKNYYEVLGVAKNATIEAIKKAHKNLILRWHSDHRQEPENNHPDAEDISKKIITAYKILTDNEQRTNYDSRQKLGSSLVAVHSRHGNMSDEDLRSKLKSSDSKANKDRARTDKATPECGTYSDKTVATYCSELNSAINDKEYVYLFEQKHMSCLRLSGAVFGQHTYGAGTSGDLHIIRSQETNLIESCNIESYIFPYVKIDLKNHEMHYVNCVGSNHSKAISNFLEITLGKDTLEKLEFKKAPSTAVTEPSASSSKQSIGDRVASFFKGL